MMSCVAFSKLNTSAETGFYRNFKKWENRVSSL